MYKPFAYGAVCKSNIPKAAKMEIIFPVRINKNKNETNGYHIMQFADRPKTGFSSWKDVTLEGNFNMETESSTTVKDYDLKEYEEQRRKKYGVLPKEDILKAEKWKINVNNNGCEQYKGEMIDQDTENCIYFVAERNACGNGLEIRQVTNWYNFEEHTPYTGLNAEQAAMQYRNRKRVFNYFASKLQNQTRAITERERAIKKTKIGDAAEIYDFDERTGADEKENDISDNDECFKKIKKGSHLSNHADNIDDIAKRNNYYESSSEETSEIEAFYYGKTMYKKLNSKQKKRKRKTPNKVRSTPVEDNNIAEFCEATTSCNPPSDSEYVPEWDFCDKDEEYAAIEESVKRYLRRKPMTLVDLLKKVIRKKDNTIPGDGVVALIAQIIKDLQPHKRKINGKEYLSLDE